MTVSTEPKVYLRSKVNDISLEKRKLDNILVRYMIIQSSISPPLSSRAGLFKARLTESRISDDFDFREFCDFSVRLSRRHAPLVTFSRIDRENNRINNRNNGPSPENNRGG